MSDSYERIRELRGILDFMRQIALEWRYEADALAVDNAGLRNQIEELEALKKGNEETLAARSAHIKAIEAELGNLNGDKQKQEAALKAEIQRLEQNNGEANKRIQNLDNERKAVIVNYERLVSSLKEREEVILAMRRIQDFDKINTGLIEKQREIEKIENDFEARKSELYERDRKVKEDEFKVKQQEELNNKKSNELEESLEKAKNAEKDCIEKQNEYDRLIRSYNEQKSQFEEQIKNERAELARQKNDFENTKTSWEEEKDRQEKALSEEWRKLGEQQEQLKEDWERQQNPAPLAAATSPIGKVLSDPAATSENPHVSEPKSGNEYLAPVPEATHSQNTLEEHGEASGDERAANDPRENDAGDKSHESINNQNSKEQQPPEWWR